MEWSSLATLFSLKESKIIVRNARIGECGDSKSAVCLRQNDVDGVSTNSQTGVIDEVRRVPCCGKFLDVVSCLFEKVALRIRDKKTTRNTGCELADRVILAQVVIHDH